MLIHYKRAVPLYLDEEFASTSLSKANTIKANSILVEQITLDDYVQEHALRPDILIMDVQGWETNVLRGMKKTLKSNSVILLFEFWPFGLENCNSSAHALRAILQEHGYSLETSDNRLPNPKKDFEELVKAMKQMKDGRGFCNFIARKI